jgi:hypothetical protein
VLLAASGGVRLHEANPAELALARALRSQQALRASGVPVIALGVGDVFGGASVLFCAADRIALVTGRRLGLSGPGVIETAHGRGELDAGDAAAVAALFGADARAARGQVELASGDVGAARRWIEASLRAPPPFATRVLDAHARLGARLRDSAAAFDRIDATRPALPCFADAEPVDAAGALWKVRGERLWLARPGGVRAIGPQAAHALDAALLAAFAAAAAQERGTLFLVEDSPGHEATRRAELVCVSQYLAQHAAVLALVASRGVDIVGLLAGTGHSAAFFANALQAPRLDALASARVVAMEPKAIARVTRLPADRIAALIDDDALVGHPVRCFAQWGGVTRVVDEVDTASLRAIV